MAAVSEAKLTDKQNDVVWLGASVWMARREQVDKSRAAMLFAAFAAEAYINEFIWAHFGEADRTALDRLPTVEKFAVAPRLALGRKLFDRGSEPLQTIRDLFRLRDTLVHPKPGKALPDEELRSADPTYNPGEAMRFALRVADAANEVVAHRPRGDQFDITSLAAAQASSKLQEIASAATKSFPMPTHPPLPRMLVMHVSMEPARDAEARS